MPLRRMLRCFSTCTIPNALDTTRNAWSSLFVTLLCRLAEMSVACSKIQINFDEEVIERRASRSPNRDG